MAGPSTPSRKGRRVAGRSPAPGAAGSLGAIIGGLAALARRPRLWPVAAREARRLTPDGWWRRAPFLPLPPPAYRRFRLQTMYGRDDHAAEPADLVRWLEWCRQH